MHRVQHASGPSLRASVAATGGSTTTGGTAREPAATSRRQSSASRRGRNPGRPRSTVRPKPLPACPVPPSHPAPTATGKRTRTAVPSTSGPRAIVSSRRTSSQRHGTPSRSRFRLAAPSRTGSDWREEQGREPRRFVDRRDLDRRPARDQRALHERVDRLARQKRPSPGCTFTDGASPTQTAKWRSSSPRNSSGARSTAPASHPRSRRLQAHDLLVAPAKQAPGGGAAA